LLDNQAPTALKINAKSISATGTDISIGSMKYVEEDPMEVSLARTRRSAVLLSNFNFSEVVMKDCTFIRVVRLFV